MWRRIAAGLACAALLSGCGVLDETGPAAERTPDPATYGPEKAVPRERPAFEAPKPRRLRRRSRARSTAARSASST